MRYDIGQNAEARRQMVARIFKGEQWPGWTEQNRCVGWGLLYDFTGRRRQIRGRLKPGHLGKDVLWGVDIRDVTKRVKLEVNAKRSTFRNRWHVRCINDHWFAFKY